MAESVIAATWSHLTAVRWRVPLAVDWLVIAASSFLFAKPYLNLDSGVLPGGPEFEGNSGVIAVARTAIRDHGEFPFWNPFVDTGTPYVADPMTHLFNPLASVPGIILGPVNGPKVAVFLTILVSGLAFYYLTAILDIWRPVRIWAALAYAFNGHMAARFNMGHFDFGLAFAFLPLAVAFTVQTARRPGGVYPFLGGLSVALVLFSGNVYYIVFLVPAVALAALFYLVSASGARPWLSLDARAAVRLAAMALWTLGIASAQLIPYFQVRDYVMKSSDPLLLGSQPVVGSLINFIQSDLEFFRSSSYDKIAGFMNEYYSYVGWAPYVGVLLLPLALARGRHRAVLFAASLFALYIAWASAAHTPFRYVMDLMPWLYKLRWTSRLLGPATLPLILLAALGFDALRTAFDLKMAGLAQFRRHRRLAALAAAPLVLAAGVFLALALQDEYQANQRLIDNLVPRSKEEQEIALALRSLDDEASLFSSVDGRWGLPLAYFDQRLQRLPISWPGELAIKVPKLGDGAMVTGELIPRPHLLVLYADAVPLEEDAQLVKVAGGRKIYRLPRSLPMAFTTRSVDPPFGPEPAWEPKASKATAHIRSPNRLDVEAEPGPGEDTLVLLQTHFPGWKVKVDGSRSQTVSNLGGYLATPAVAGRHTYSFVFDPAPQHWGLAISAGTILGAGLLYVFDRRRRVAAALGRAAAAPAAVRNVIPLLRRAK
jgi:hypothetical protein